MFGWECDPAGDGRLSIAEYREQFRGKVGHQATISGHMGSKRGTLAQVFDSFAIFTVDGSRRKQPGCRRTLCVDFASVHSGDTLVEWL